MNEEGKIKMNKILKLFLYIIGLSFIVIATYMIIRINHKYPEKQVEYISLGETEFVEEDIKMTVMSCNWANQDEIIGKYGITSEVGDDINSKTALVSVDLENTTQSSKIMKLYNIYIEKNGYCNGLSPELYGLYNNKNMELEMDPGESTTVILTYTVYEIQFSRAQWDELEKQEFYLANQRYPVKQYWNIW